MRKNRPTVLAAALHGFFSDYLPRQRALSLHTLHSYRDSLKLLSQFVAGKKADPSQLTIEQLTVEQLTAFLQRLRDFVLLIFLFNTGARVSEAVGLQACDLRLTSPASVLLRGKGRKERVCPLWPETAHALRTHLERQGTGLHEARSVFLNHRSHPLTRFGVRVILQKQLSQAVRKSPTLKDKRLHPHSHRSFERDRASDEKGVFGRRDDRRVKGAGADQWRFDSECSKRAVRRH